MSSIRMQQNNSYSYDQIVDIYRECAELPYRHECLYDFIDVVSKAYDFKELKLIKQSFNIKNHICHWYWCDCKPDVTFTCKRRLKSEVIADIFHYIRNQQTKEKSTQLSYVLK